MSLEPITIPSPETITRKQPVTVPLSAEQLAAVKAKVVELGIEFPDDIATITINVARDLSASVRFTFRAQPIELPA